MKPGFWIFLALLPFFTYAQDPAPGPKVFIRIIKRDEAAFKKSPYDMPLPSEAEFDNVRAQMKETHRDAYIVKFLDDAPDDGKGNKNALVESWTISTKGNKEKFNSRIGTLEVWLQGKDGRYSLAKSYPVSSYSGLLGPKLQEGDNQTPEGFYSVSAKDLNSQSKHTLGIDIGYPNDFDKIAYPRKPKGKWVEIHGGTLAGSCIGMGQENGDDHEIKEIFRYVQAALKNGQKEVPVHIFPFRLSDENLKKYDSSDWRFPFWRQLQAGYLAFESAKIPPTIAVKDKKYVVTSDYKPAPAPEAPNGTEPIKPAPPASNPAEPDV